MKKILCLILLSLFFPSLSLGADNTWSGNTATCTACADANCTAAEVQACVDEIQDNEVGKTGIVTLQLPAMDDTWTAAVTINMSTGYSGITQFVIRGYGNEPAGAGSAGQSLITNYGFTITPHQNKRIRISNLTLSGTGASCFTSAFFKVDGYTDTANGGGYRFDHNTWDYIVIRAYILFGDAFGVVDHNNGDVCYQFAGPKGRNTYGNVSWDNGASLGSIYSTYFEDNEIEYHRDCNVCQGSPEPSMMFSNPSDGGRTCIRHNTLTNFYLGGHDASTGYRSGLQYEAYDNILRNTITDDRVFPPIGHRGGTGVFYNNDLRHINGWYGGSSTGITLRNMRDSAFGSNTWTGTMNVCGSTDVKAYLGVPESSWGVCTSGATCLDIDGDTGTASPCRDQVGTGDNASPQTLMPMLFWNNTDSDINGNNSIDATVTESSSSIVQNTHYCQHETTMPATCGGVATTYVEYQYPHPFVSGSVTPSGTVVPGIVNETDVVNGFTLTVTISDDTFGATLGADNAVTQAFIDGFDSDGSEAHGWNNEVRDVIDFTAVTRDSDTQATVVIPATATFEITAGNENITLTIDSSVVAGDDNIICPPFYIVDQQFGSTNVSTSSNMITNSGVGTAIGSGKILK